jgi:hypothetical protein
VPADLDELFDALGRQADAIPLGGSGPARQRGKSLRARNRAVLAAAAVVALLVGVGVTVTRERRGADPILPATYPARIRGIAPLGEPLRLPGDRIWTGARIAGDRVVGFSGGTDGRHESVAVDTATGATAWKLSGQEGFYRGVATTPEVVAFLREVDLPSEALTAAARRVLEFHDPSTGVRRWELPYTDHDQVVFHQDVLAHRADATGTIEGRDIVTGKVLWKVQPGADRPRSIIGMRTEADGHEVSGSGDPDFFDPSSQKVFPYTDDRLVELSGKGNVTIRDIRTGEVLSSTPGRPGVGSPTAFEGTVAYSLLDDGRWTIGTTSKVLYRAQAPWDPNGYFLCAQDRLCVHEVRQGATEQQEARLLVIDVTGGGVLRTSAAIPPVGYSAVRNGHLMTSGGGGAGGNGTALYDEDGRPMYSDGGFGGFVDNGNALTLSRDARDGRYIVRAISNIDFEEIRIGSMPEISGRCDWNDELLTCPAGKELWIWRFTR